MNLAFMPLVGYENMYEININGVIISKKRLIRDTLGRLKYIKSKSIKINIDKRSGYAVVKLSKPNGKYGTQYLHRLIAKNFIENPLNKKNVNHINGNKKDYSLSNLEWVTRSENQIHAIQNNFAKIPRKNAVSVNNTCTGVKYPSMTIAAKNENIKYDTLKKIFAGLLPNNTCLQKVA